MKSLYNLAIMLLIFILCACNNSPETGAMEKPEIDSELEKQIGQMIMAGFRGFTIDEINPAFIQQIREGHIGGIILFDYDVVKKKAERNIRSPEQVKQLITDLQEKAELPLFVAVDQEGGKVNRLKAAYGFPASVSAQYLGELDNLDSTRYYAQRTANTLTSLGFNVNFAPVADVNVNPASPAIGNIERSYSADPDVVIKHAAEVVNVQAEKGIISTLKHFPGHGSATADSHKGVTDITNYWSKEELKPFKVISQTAPSVAIMTAHVVNNKIDSLYPATMSEKVINDILRKDLGFSGLVFSDDLQMKAVNKMYPFETILERAILAGVDVLVMGNNLELEELAPQKAVKIIYTLVQEGKISRERIQQSYDRILSYKKIKKR